MAAVQALPVPVDTPGALSAEAHPDQAVSLWCERAADAMASASSVAEARSVRDWASTLEHATRLRDLNADTVRKASALKLEAERRVGELIREGQERGEIAGRGNPNLRNDENWAASENAPKTIPELGLTHNEAAAAKKLAEPPREEFDRALEEAAVESPSGTISRNKVLDKVAGPGGKSHSRRDRKVEDQATELLGREDEANAERLRANFARLHAQFRTGLLALSPEHVAAAIDDELQWQLIEETRRDAIEWFDALRAARPKPFTVIDGGRP